MKSHRLAITALVLLTAAIVGLLQIASISAQQPMKSPRQAAEMTLNGKKISVDYGAPSVRGRKVFGELVPFNQVWRLGANKATHLTTEANLMFGKVEVPAGTYTLFAIPAETGWKLIINKTTGQWGIPYKPEYEKTELARVEMKVAKTAAPVELMVISLAQAGKGGTLKVDWENTSASIGFTEKK